MKHRALPVNAPVGVLATSIWNTQVPGNDNVLCTVLQCIFRTVREKIVFITNGIELMVPEETLGQFTQVLAFSGRDFIQFQDTARIN